MTSLFHPGDQPTETTFSTRRIYTDYPSVTENDPAYELNDMTLSQTLALIKYIGMCGYSEFDSIHIVLARLSKAIMVLLKHCVRADKDEYCEFIYALLKGSDVVVEKLIIRAVNACTRRVHLGNCHLIIKEVHSLAALIYCLTNPLNLPSVLTKDYGLKSWHGLSVSSLQTNYLLEAADNLRNALLEYFDTLEIDECDESSVNITPLKLYSSIVLDSIDMASKLMETIVTNTVPTNVTFRYFQDLLASTSVQITDIENFESFIGHFQKVDDLAKLFASTPLYDLQKKLIKPTFLEIIGEFPSVQPTWCTPAQAVNYLQAFIDVYNTVYDEDLYIERVWNSLTNIENTVVKKESNQVRVDKGHYKLHHGDFGPMPVPAFVRVFESPGSNNSAQPEQELIFSPRHDSLGGDTLGQRKNDKDASASTTPMENEKNFLDEDLHFTFVPHEHEPPELNTDFIPTDEKYAQVYEINERVALEVRTMRAEAEKSLGRDRILFRDNNCLKCKFVPWHKHKFPF